MMTLRYRNTFLIVAIVYMFLNSFLLPEGLLYTTLISPFMFLFLLNHKGIRVYAAFLAVSLFYVCIHWGSISFPASYLKSFALLQCIGIFVIHSYYMIQRYIDAVKVFKVLGMVNLGLLLVSCATLWVSALSDLLWYKVPISPGIPVIPRLKMLTYEASYYSLVIFPVAAYYLLKVWLLRAKRGIILYSLLLSLLLSFSLGVWAGIIISLLLLFLFYPKTFYRNTSRKLLIWFIIILILSLLFLHVFYPDNPLYQRIDNIFSGTDTSARGRTYEAFSLAVHIARMKSLIWGIGLGQLKEIGRDYIIQYYHYSHIPDTVRIPNAVAETINIFGISGLVIRFVLIGYLFFRTRVWTHYYRLFLFIFMFIYQFTGSFIFNVAEYMIWILAFSPGILPFFEVREQEKETCKHISR